MESIKLWARDGAAVCQAIELGEIAHIETARCPFRKSYASTFWRRQRIE